MEKLLNFLVKEITKTPKVKVSRETHDDTDNYVIALPQEFIPQIIGKNGRIISAVRTLALVLAAKENLRIGIEVKEL